MTAPPGCMPDLEHDGTPGRIRVSKVVRHRLARALHLSTGMDYAAARRVIAQRANDPVEELEAYLRTTFKLDPTGVTAVRNAMRAA